jgi:hypothetical protein
VHPADNLPLVRGRRWTRGYPPRVHRSDRARARAFPAHRCRHLQPLRRPTAEDVKPSRLVAGRALALALNQKVGCGVTAWNPSAKALRSFQTLRPQIEPVSSPETVAERAELILSTFSDDGLADVVGRAAKPGSIGPPAQWPTSERSSVVLRPLQEQATAHRLSCFPARHRAQLLVWRGAALPASSGQHRPILASETSTARSKTRRLTTSGPDEQDSRKLIGGGAGSQRDLTTRHGPSAILPSAGSGTRCSRRVIGQTVVGG